MQARYWRLLTDKRYKLIYINEYSDQCIKLQRMINVFLAITSSGAIAAWAIWKDYPFIWAGIIAISQVITAIKPYLPFEKRIEVMDEIIVQFTRLCNEMEAKWFYIANGTMTEEQINELYYDIEKRWTDIENGSLRGDSIPADPRLAAIANKKKDEYFDLLFNKKDCGFDREENKNE